jgi:NodT family efflux transporter outer membrane factor (OMF) lipoprotein
VGGSGGGRSRIQNQFNLTAGASWEIDVWGRIRRTVESDVANAQASAADLAAALLSAQAALATDYLALRISDELKRLLEETVEADTRSLEITQNRYAAGTAARSDVAQALAQVEGVKAQAINVGVHRAQLEHAIAVRIGKPPAEFSIAPAPLTLQAPVMPPGVPSALLERRPDIAASERAVAAANAQIGVAIAAYYPAITLSASYGFVSSAIETLLRASNAVWSVGPQLAETVFDAGLRSAQVAAARAAHDQTVANYRQTVLAAFQQVEDQLASLRILEQQAEVQERAVKASEEAERLILNQYKAGTVAYTSVITAQTVSLGDKQTALSILGSRLAASVVLIEALGGGWTTAELPSHDQIRQGSPPAGTGAPSP